MSTKTDYNANAGFQGYKKARKKEILSRHRDDAASWIKSRLIRRKGLKTHASKGIAPTSAALGMAAVSAPGLFTLPLAGATIPTAQWAGKKIKGHATRLEMERWARDLFADPESGTKGHITQKSAQQLLSQTHTLTEANCEKWLAWYGFDGIGNMMESLAKLKDAMGAYESAVREFNEAKTIKGYLTLVDAMLYAIYRLRRVREYAAILLILAGKWFEHATESVAGVDIELREAVAKAGEYCTHAKTKRATLN